MGKQYAYFRMPNGKPSKGSGAKHAPVHILSEIGKSSVLDSDGSISWDMYDIVTMRLQAALQYAVVAYDPQGVELDDAATSRIVVQALNEMIRATPGTPVDPASFLNRVNKLVAEFFRKPLTRYVLVTSLSVSALPAKMIRVGSCLVSPLKERGKKYSLPKALSAHLAGTAISTHIATSKYQLVKVFTEGREIFDAAENALNSLSLLRGLWSLFATFRSFTIRFGGIKRHPLGVIHTGPIHTLHRLDGSMVDGYQFWYDPDFSDDQPIYERTEGWTEVEKRRRWAMRRLCKLSHRKDLENLLIRYVNALDQPNTDIAFLQMWSILEKITDTIGGNYDDTIAKTVWPIQDRQDRLVGKNILGLLRQRRNLYVHSGRTGQASDQVAYVIKSFVDPHLVLLISNVFNVKSLEEYARFLALSKDAGALEQHRRTITRALRILRRERETSLRE